MKENHEQRAKCICNFTLLYCSLYPISWLPFSMILVLEIIYTDFFLFYNISIEFLNKILNCTILSCPPCRKGIQILIKVLLGDHVSC